MTDLSDITYEHAGSFLSNDEIVNHLISDMDEDAKKSWTEISRDQLILGHHGIGRHIRNYYLMWHPENPYSNSNVAQYEMVEELSNIDVSKIDFDITKVWNKKKEA